MSQEDSLGLIGLGAQPGEDVLVIPPKQRLLLVRCKDTEGLNIRGRGMQESPLEHFCRLYDVCCDQTEFGASLCLCDKKLPWQDPDKFRQELNFGIMAKAPEVIGLMDHDQCKAYEHQYGKMTKRKCCSVQEHNLRHMRNQIGAWFPQFSAPGKILMFRVDRSYRLVAIDDHTRRIHKQRLASMATAAA
jgi:hypothetical protein